MAILSYAVKTRYCFSAALLLAIALMSGDIRAISIGMSSASLMINLRFS